LKAKREKKQTGAGAWAGGKEQKEGKKKKSRGFPNQGRNDKEKKKNLPFLRQVWGLRGEIREEGNHGHVNWQGGKERGGKRRC